MDKNGKLLCKGNETDSQFVYSMTQSLKGLDWVVVSFMDGYVIHKFR